ncbi:MAG: HEAT repeat domain-containing protein [Gammaproteobacteria bacterium]
MTTTDTNEQMEHRVIQYLYGDLSGSELQRFEQELADNPQLAQMLEREQRFNSAVPVGVQPAIDEERLQGNRWLLRQNLQREAAPRFSVAQALRNLTQRPLMVALQGAAMAMTFVLGLFVAGFSTQPGSAIDSAPTLAQGMTPLSLLSEDDYEIYQLQVNSYDAMTGDIDLSFSLASETRLRGNVADQNVSQLMAVALQDDIDSASRLDTINALQPVISGDQVYEALIYVLTNDQNPGVRYQAVQSLVALSDQERVRDALRYALREDVNEGVRVEAFNALSQYRDEETLAIFRQKVDADSNEYIRTQSRVIIEEEEGSSTDDLIF